MTTKEKIRLSCILFLFSVCSTAQAAKVDSLDIPSVGMHRTYKAAVVLPVSYAKNKAAYPVLYLYITWWLRTLQGLD